jgi:hypothetical protein
VVEQALPSKAGVSYESFRFARPKDPAEAIPLDDGDMCIHVQCPMSYAPEQGLQPRHPVRPPKILWMMLSWSFSFRTS